MKSASLIFLLSGLMVACNSGFKNDPLKDFSKNVQEAIPPEKKKEPTETKAVPNNAIIFETPDFFELVEGVEKTFEVSGRIVQYNNDFTLTAPLAAEELPGITSNDIEVINNPNGNEKVLRIKWKPTGIAIKAGEYFTTRKLTLVMTVEEKTEMKQIPVYIYRAKANQPKIKSISSWVNVNEGSKGSMDIVVEDPDSSGTAAPRLLLGNPTLAGRKSGVMFLSMNAPVASFSNPLEWTYKVNIDIPESANPVSTWSEDVFFSVQAISSLGNISLSQDARYTITNTNAKPVTDWSESSWNPPTFSIGQKNSFTFTVIDPRSEAQVNVNFSNCAGWQATCGCKSINTFVQLCTVEADLPATTLPTNFDITFRANVGSTQYVTFKRTIKVVQ